jgi:hypothetical protein
MIPSDDSSSEICSASATNRSENCHRVVIVGGGFGGLEAVTGLAGEPVTITLIDRRNYHLFQPLLYQVAWRPQRSPGRSATLCAGARR